MYTPRLGNTRAEQEEVGVRKRRRGLLRAVALVAPGVVGDLVGGDVIAMVARRPAAVLVVAVDEVGVGVVVQRDDDLRVLPLVVLGVVFNVAAAGLVEGELAVAVQIIVVRGCGGDGGVLPRGRGNRRPILCGRPLVHLQCEVCTTVFYNYRMETPTIVCCWTGRDADGCCTC